MNEEFNPGVDGSQTELPEVHFHKAPNKKWERTVEPDPVQLASISCLAEHVIRHLSERHSHSGHVQSQDQCQNQSGTNIDSAADDHRQG